MTGKEKKSFFRINFALMNCFMKVILCNMLMIESFLFETNIHLILNNLNDNPSFLLLASIISTLSSLVYDRGYKIIYCHPQDMMMDKQSNVFIPVNYLEIKS
jgi:hypothetical protein